MFRALLVASALVLLSAHAAHADPPPPPPNLAWTQSSENYQANVEQWPGATNPTLTNSDPDCVWDFDDQATFSAGTGSNAGAKFNTGATATIQFCVYADTFHTIGLYLASSSPDLTYTVTFANAADIRVFQVNSWAGPDAHDWHGCVTTPGFQSDSTWLQTISGSNGGKAVETVVQLQIHNNGATIDPTNHQNPGFVQATAYLENPLVLSRFEFLCPTVNSWTFPNTTHTDPVYKYDSVTDIT